MTDAPVATIDRPRFLDTPAVAAVLAALPGARAVGGCVRDALAGRASADVDVAAPLPPEQIAARLRAAGLKVFETGLAHGTVTAVLDHAPVEVTALRRDLLTDGRHATVEWSTDWREDAARRDFTINAMSLAPDGALFDYFTGRADLAAGRGWRKTTCARCASSASRRAMAWGNRMRRRSRPSRAPCRGSRASRPNASGWSSSASCRCRTRSRQYC
jgi:hypothetical protein